MLLLVLPFKAMAQQQSPEEREKKFHEAIELEIEKYTNSLKLDAAQVFYVDSILNHDYVALQDELMELNRTGKTQTALYEAVQDKWMENMYNAFHRILSEDQWQKYLKNGAARDKKARDKREAKRLKK